MRIGFAILTLLFAVAHFFATFMIGFITGTTQSGNRPLMFVQNVLTFPLWLLPISDDSPFSGKLGWLLWMAVSLLWGMGLSAIFWAIVMRLARTNQ